MKTNDLAYQGINMTAHVIMILPQIRKDTMMTTKRKVRMHHKSHKK